MSRWFRPDPLCCSHLDEPCKQEVPLESVIEVYWQCQIPLSEYNKQRSSGVQVRNPTTSSKDLPNLKLGLLFTPHCCLGDVIPKAATSLVEVIRGEEQQSIQTNISLQQFDETMLPKALHCLYHKAEATVYQILWKSNHGTAYFQVKKTMPRKNVHGNQTKMSLVQQYNQDPKLERWTHVLTNFLNLWVARAPEKLRRSMVEWMQKANEKKLVCLDH
ncbi:hypothetical protein EJB05_06031, partial [Eragrostis curvula]